MSKQTSLFQKHIDANAKMVDFAGWDMPVNYGSQIEEHHIVRKEAGMFDVSHMVITDYYGDKVKEFLEHTFANDINKLKSDNRAIYTCMLNDNGGIIDDLIIYIMENNRYRIVSNAGTRDKDIAHIKEQAKAFSVEVVERETDAIIAVQGPKARDIVLDLFQNETLASLPRFGVCEFDNKVLARTGYTGEDGFEIMLSAEESTTVWDKLLEKGVKPVGLGARDTLRLEAGMNLYGQDMDENITPLECGLSWTTKLNDDRDFVGKKALINKKENLTKKMIAIVLEGKGILRHAQEVICEGYENGIVTSGSFSPTLEQSIALAIVPKEFSGDNCLVQIRKKQVPAKIIKLPFVKKV